MSLSLFHYLFLSFSFSFSFVLFRNNKIYIYIFFLIYPCNKYEWNAHSSKLRNHDIFVALAITIKTWFIINFIEPGKLRKEWFFQEYQHGQFWWGEGQIFFTQIFFFANLKQVGWFNPSSPTEIRVKKHPIRSKVKRHVISEHELKAPVKISTISFAILYVQDVLAHFML